MCVPVVHCVVTVPAECDQVPWFPLVVRIELSREDMVDMVSRSHPAVALALLADIVVTSEDS